MVVDVSVLREQFRANISFFDKKLVQRLRYNNIHSGEYFNEGENPDIDLLEMEILAITENSDEYMKDSVGNILITSYKCMSTYDLDIEGSDFMIFNDYDLYRIEGLNKIEHPITGEEIGKSFQLIYVETLDSSDLMR
jgi:hypothetical protein